MSSELFNIYRSKEKPEKVRLSVSKHLIPYIKARWKQSLLASALVLIVSFLAVPSPYIIKYIVDDVLSAKNIKLLYLMLFVLILIQIVKSLFSFLAHYNFETLNQKIITEIKKNLFYHIVMLPFSFFDKHQTGYLNARIGEVDSLSLFFSKSTVQILISFFEFIFCLTVLFFLSWKLTLISLSLLPLLYIGVKFFSWRIRKSTYDVLEKDAVVDRSIQDSLSGIETIKVFSAEKRESSKVYSGLKRLKQSKIRQSIITSFSSEMGVLFGAVGGFVVLWYSGLSIIKGSFTIGSYIAFSAYLARLYGPTRILSNIGLYFQSAIAGLERLSELLDLSQERKKKKNIKLKKLKGDIEFRDVFFSYDTKKVLKNINLNINQGETILITGPNGSGKSTLIKLLLRLYSPQKGEILIDGYTIDNLCLFSLRNRISVISQNIFFFNDTIKNNILYSSPEAKEEEMERASELSGAYEFIKKLNNGFETTIGEVGKKLSGGEKQKISIARAVLKDADIIIFDEPTTYLDVASVRKFEILHEKFLRNKTCIFISHKRLHLSQIDKIFVMKEGEILNELTG